MTTNYIAQLQVDGVYTTYPVFEAEGTEVVLGPDIDWQLRPNTLDLTWRNADLSMDPSNPSSPLYGKIGRQTPVRLRIGAGPTTMFAGGATEWIPDELPGSTATTGRRSVGFKASGDAYLAGQWTDPIESAMTRQNGSVSSLLGYWPLEGGGSDTTQIDEASNAYGAAPGSVGGTINFGADPGPGGGDETLTIGTGGALAARFARVATSGWQIAFHTKLKTLPTSATQLEIFGANLSNGNRLQVMIANATYLFQVIDPAGAVKGSFGAFFGAGVDPTKWIRYRIKATFSAGTVLIEPAWYPQDAGVIYGVSFSYADSGTGALLNWQVGQNAWTQDAAYAHILATSNTTVNLVGAYNFVKSFDGYLGESAADRALRVGQEQGFTVTIVGNASDSISMGRQKPAALTDIWEQCRQTDGAMMFEAPNSGLVNFRTRRNIQDQTVVLALTKGQTSPPLKPIIGNNLVVNDVTVSNASGSKTRVVRTTGPLSIQPPPAGVSRFRKTLDVNLASDLLMTDRGNWEASIGTVDRRWYKQITIDLLRNASLLTTIAGLKPGDLITLAGAEPDLVRLLLCNVTWTIQSAPVKAVLTCLPADGWTVGKYDDTAARRDATFSTTSGVTAAGALSIGVTNPVLVDCWSTTAVPYDVKIAGERMTVTAATAPAGTGPYTQTLTVTPGVNGVSKGHAANESVQLANPIHYGLF